MIGTLQFVVTNYSLTSDINENREIFVLVKLSKQIAACRREGKRREVTRREGIEENRKGEKRREEKMTGTEMNRTKQNRIK